MFETTAREFRVEISHVVTEHGSRPSSIVDEIPGGRRKQCKATYFVSQNISNINRFVVELHRDILNNED
jgi:hypothetical protein